METGSLEIELNKVHWSALFEPYLFFESYKNYLQVDIVATDIDVFCTWKDWVESRLRRLSLMCHPYPHGYVDTSRQCAHCAFFVGLRRKQGEIVQEGQQFDIHGTVEEFRHSVNMYMFWKPGMDIYVSHVRRRQIPSYVFPDGYKRSRPSRPTVQLENPLKSIHRDEVSGIEHGDRNHKRTYDDRMGMKQDVLKKQSTSPLRIVECVNLSNKGQDKSDKRTQSPDPEPECSSNSSVITSVTSDGGSFEDVGSGLLEVCGGDNTRAIEPTFNGRFQDTTYGTDSVTFVENAMASGNEVLQDELQEQLEEIESSFSSVRDQK